MLAAGLQAETRRVAARSLADIRTAEDWHREKPKARTQLFEMLGLDPLPPRTDLKATVTGKLEQPEFTVEKLHFQSRPGLYVTANLYVPRALPRPAPAILYVCGHAQVKTNEVSYGNKVAYQHHGVWLARNGYVCLMIDTIELGEIAGIHHGTYREGMWWWNSRGYTPAGVEAWNCIRALDYLETRPEVDKNRLGVTGRSGGGAYSWWVAALDERVRAACPVAGITDLENYVVDGVVEGHCDCMFMVNTWRWDYAKVAALVAPRPLLIANTDRDTIFPLDGVTRIHQETRRIYDLLGAADNVGLLIAPGPHKDSQDLQVPVLRWFNRHLRQEERPVTNAALPLFTGQQLRVFEQLPADEITSLCHETFTRLADPEHPLPAREAIAVLRNKTFGGWPASAGDPEPRLVASGEHDATRLSVYEFASEPGIRLRFYLVRPVSAVPVALRIEALDDVEWRRRIESARAGFASALPEELAGLKVPPEAGQGLAEWARRVREERQALVFFPPRGAGLSALAGDQKYQTQVRRRFMLLGQTLAGMQVWDLQQAAAAVRRVEGLTELPLHIAAGSALTEVAAFATLFTPRVTSLTLGSAPRPDKEAPDFLNWSRIVTAEQLLALARAQCVVNIRP
jgi:dienelactone hydrolase